MARRGSNSFRRNDGIRALKIAKDSGIEPSMMEVVVGKDGAVTFRVYGEQAAGLLPVAPETAAEAREWQDEIAKIKKAKAPKKRVRAMSEPPNKPARRRAPSNFRQQDVARAIKAAKGSGLDIVRVEVDPKTAKITLVVKNDDNTGSVYAAFLGTTLW